MNDHIKGLIIKFLSNEANLEELMSLELWLTKSENEIVFLEFIRLNHYSNKALGEFDIETAKSKILKEINIIRKQKLNYIFKYVAASLVLGILSTTYFLKENIYSSPTTNSSSSSIEYSTTIEAGTDKAVLILEEGLEITLQKNEDLKTLDASSDGKTIIYNKKVNNKNELRLHTLTVPRGGQFIIELSDGTKVWLNSESQLRYPVSFIQGRPREVELVYGEAYFDVSPSTENSGTSFVVLNQEQKINVVGTEFNLKAYKNENVTKITLVEGIIDIYGLENTLRLSPNQQLKFDHDTNSLLIKDIDVFNEISWKEGIFSFENVTLEEVMKVLSRWYNAEIIIKNESIKNKEFIGILRKNRKIETVLESIKSYDIIQNYLIEDDRIELE